MTDKFEMTDEDFAQAFYRLGLGRLLPGDNRLIYSFFHEIGLDVLNPNPSDSALRANYGERTLASNVMDLMAKGLDESGGRTDSTDGSRPSQQLAVFVNRKPVAVAKRESYRQWLERTAGSPGAD